MLVLIQPAKGANDFNGGAETGERVDGENLRFLNRTNAFVGVFVQQGLQHALRLFAVAGEVIALLDLLGALFSGERRLIPGYVADQIKGVEFLAGLAAYFFCQRFKENPFVGQFVNDGLLLVGIVSAPQKIIQRTEFFGECAARVVLE